MDPPGLAPLAEMAMKCRKELNSLAGKYARTTTSFRIHQIEFREWLAAYHVFEKENVEWSLDYLVRNKLEARCTIYIGLESLLLEIYSAKKQIRDVEAAGLSSEATSSGTTSKEVVKKDAAGPNQDALKAVLAVCQNDMYCVVQLLGSVTEVLARASTYVHSELMTRHPEFVVRDEWEADVSQVFEMLMKHAISVKCQVRNELLHRRLAEMICRRRRALNYHWRYHDHSPMNILRDNLNPPTFWVTMRAAESGQHPAPPTLAPGQERNHVLNDLEPYVCVFIECRAATKTFRNKHEWLYHMEVHHGSTWKCLEAKCRNRTFHTQISFEQHGINAHDYTTSQMSYVCRYSRRPSPAVLRSCPFCGPRAGDPPANDEAYIRNLDAHAAAHRLYDHVAAHLEQFALLALPFIPDAPVFPGRNPEYLRRRRRERQADNDWEWDFSDTLSSPVRGRRDVCPGSSRSSVSTASSDSSCPLTPDGFDLSELVSVVPPYTSIAGYEILFAEELDEDE
ncbi:uncharacterized protein BO97DRAFT_452950 [Aspergillus homomorphus CBS 101889]|uniref:C2H2-type domain-containing protein n=1 Tax=Aspergillus homomorphus (strain CBS 101889) TaxID=1450537 RepID=A0A395IA96_ASPHC|nr:hypothetical protein BO97DRAFT_452950 [Aspergillus homomorphus CBS 101889]RAL16956.1 hypothetical protein BO97DRAFT_452950 [Aspergillus homomorphus CBS 101889]